MSTLRVSAIHMGTIANLEVPKEYARQLRRADDLTKLLVACTHSAINSAHHEFKEQINTGLFLGTSFGPLETNFRFLDTLLDDGEGQASPTLFSHSVHNAAAGYLSRIFNILGPSFTITSFAWPFLTALKQAACAVASGTIDRAIVATAELHSPVLGFARNQLTNDTLDVYPSGAVCWILDKKESKNVDRPLQLLEIEIHEKSCEVDTFLTRAGEEFSSNKKTESSKGVLAYAFSLTENVQKTSRYKNGNVLWSTKAPFGRASVLLSL
jgi:hypothetical protein